MLLKVILADHLAYCLLKRGVPKVQGRGMAVPAPCVACRAAFGWSAVGGICNFTVSREDSFCLRKAIAWVCTALEPLVGPLIASELQRVVHKACTLEVQLWDRHCF